MAQFILGREIVSGILLRGHSPENYLDLGWDLNWLSSNLEPVFASVFQDQDVDAYRYILKYWENHGTTPDVSDFQRGFPPQSYRLSTRDVPQSRLVEDGIKAACTYIIEVATVEAQRFLEAGDWAKSRDIMAEASERTQHYADNNSPFRLVSMADVEPEQTEWLWEDRLPLGAISVTGGKPGIGKSQFAAWLTAKVTTGKLEGDLHGTPRNVLYVYVEDSLSKTLVPRLQAAGADMSRVYRLTLRDDPKKNYLPDISKNLGLIRREVQRNNIALVVFDPLVSVTKVDRNHSDEVRKILQDLAMMAEETNVAIHGLMHLRKQSAEDMLTQIGGSGDWGAIVRAALGFAASDDPDDPYTVMSQIKNNLGRSGLPSLRFTIEDATVPARIGVVRTSRLAWEGVSAFSAQEVAQGKNSTEAQTKVDQAVEWLEELLLEGGRAKTEIIAIDQAESNFGEQALKRAFRKMNGKSVREGFPAVATWHLADAPKEVVPQYAHEGTM